MKQNLKRNIVVATVLVFVCAAVYLNWSYNNKWGSADSAMVEAEDAAMAAAEKSYNAALMNEEAQVETYNSYFANARLTRQQSRDAALGLLESAAASEGASQETISSAMDSITVMASWSMTEAQIENLLLAKEFDDCVVYMRGDGITVAVPAPVDGLSEASVARITDVILSETDFAMSQINLIEVRDNKEASAITDTADEIQTAAELEE